MPDESNLSSCSVYLTTLGLHQSLLAGAVHGWFVLDCGAGGLAIAPWVAEQAGLSPLGGSFSPHLSSSTLHALNSSLAAHWAPLLRS
jgi:hypothetical protein